MKNTCISLLGSLVVVAVGLFLAEILEWLGMPSAVALVVGVTVGPAALALPAAALIEPLWKSGGLVFLLRRSRAKSGVDRMAG